MAAIFARSQPQYFEKNEAFSMGLSWLISTLPNRQVLYLHNGSSGDYTSFIGLDKSEQTGVAIL